MRNVARALLSFIASFFRTRASLQLEILALRRQLAVAQRSVRRPRLRPADRSLWAWLSGPPTLNLRVLFVLVILAHDRRRVVHFGITEHPTAGWERHGLLPALPPQSVVDTFLCSQDVLDAEQRMVCAGRPRKSDGGARRWA